MNSRSGQACKPQRPCVDTTAQELRDPSQSLQHQNKKMTGLVSKGVIKKAPSPPWECESLELALKPVQSSPWLYRFKRVNLVCKSLMRPWGHRRNLQPVLLIPTARRCSWPCLHFLQFLRKETTWLKIEDCALPLTQGFGVSIPTV